MHQHLNNFQSRQAAQRLVCTATSATMPKKITEHGPDATSTTDGIFDVCSPPGGAPETDHLSCPPDSSGASEASDEDWEPGGSECESQCHGTICVRARRAVTGPRSVRRFPITYSSAFRARPIAKMATAHQTGQGRMMCSRSLQQESPTKHQMQWGLVLQRDMLPSDTCRKEQLRCSLTDPRS